MNSTRQATVAVLVVLALSVSAFPQDRQLSAEAAARKLIAELYVHAWEGAENSCSPMCWNFHFTEPMQKILNVGTPAQDALLEKLDDAAIKDQIIILLGGVGDERAVGPIIDAMVAQGDVSSVPNAEKINSAANLALTNITVSEVIWHHGGGIAVRRCPDNPKECWAAWWKKNKATFSVKGIKRSRRYSNYPNYGVYREAM